MRSGVVVALLDTDGDGVGRRPRRGRRRAAGRPERQRPFQRRSPGFGRPDAVRRRSHFLACRGQPFLPDRLQLAFRAAAGCRAAELAAPALGRSPEGRRPGRRRCLGSFLEEKSCVFHEDIPVPGTDLTLHYASSRVAGYKPGVITVPASGDTVPRAWCRSWCGPRWPAAARGDPAARAQAGGPDRVGRPGPPGRPVSGSLAAHVEIGFVYYGVFYRPAANGPAFGQLGRYPC